MRFLIVIFVTLVAINSTSAKKADKITVLDSGMAICALFSEKTFFDTMARLACYDSLARKRGVTIDNYVSGYEPKSTKEKEYNEADQKMIDDLIESTQNK